MHQPMERLISSRPQTQKARGILSLIKGIDEPAFPAIAERNHIFLLSRHTKLPWSLNGLVAEVMATYFGAPANTWMARPCPVTPRHGFVESRVVTTTQDLQKVMDETFLADPRGEVILMPFIPAEYSGVVTNQSVSVGLGHDGATSGKGAIAVPCVSDLGAWLDKLGMIRTLSKVTGLCEVTRSRYAGIAPARNRHPYFELVNSTIVQARYGPEVNGAQTSWSSSGNRGILIWDYWEPSHAALSDFLGFEIALLEYKKASVSPVMYLPYGTLSCHAAVQAICAGVTVITGPNRPVVGEYYPIRASQLAGVRYLGSPETPIRESLLAAIALPLAAPEGKNCRRQTVLWAVSVIQGMASAPMAPQLMRYVAVAGTILLRFGMAACFGEHRHWNSKGPCQNGQNPIGPVLATLATPIKYAHKQTEHSRALVHQASLKAKLTTATQIYMNLARITAIKSDFATGTWRSSYGGPKWAECTTALEEIMLVWMRLYFRVQPTAACLPLDTERRAYATLTRQLMAACNRFITVSHNGGKCLTKFVTTNELAAATIAPGLFLVHPYTRRFYYDPGTCGVPSTAETEELTDDNTGSNNPSD